eukprot:TRINITY_DN5753_c0_g1_i2.p1 TRINITY_DN5753_c0_g1~~TRINITY_DN5753_c0_g1_i2.p1  ORF type:complete len:467 (+),score=87.85 TRINITY_DN5753_c0_g1_i2:64-1464(+)
MDVSAYVTTTSQHVEVTVGEHETLAGLKHKVAEQLGLESNRIEVLHMEDVSDEDEVAAYLPEGVQVRIKDEEFRAENLLQDHGIPLTIQGMKDCVDRDLTELLPVMKQAGLDVYAFPHHITIFAVRKKHLQAVKVLQEMGLNFSAHDDTYRYTPLHYAAQQGCPEIIDYLSPLNPGLVDLKSKEGFTPLHCAVTEDERSSVEALLRNKANVNIRNIRGMSPLHVAVSAARHDSSMVALLLRHGAFIHAKDSEGFSPMHCMTSIPEVIDLLVSKGANVNAISNNKSTPLHSYVVQYASSDVVARLLERGADINAQDEQGKTPVHHMLTYDIRFSSILKRKADVTVRDHSGRTPLHTVGSKIPEFLKYMNTDTEAMLNLRDREGKTPLHYQTDRDTIKALVELGADVNAVDINNQTPMFCKNASLRKLYISLGASPTHKDVYNFTPDRKVSPAERQRRDAFRNTQAPV